MDKPREYRNNNASERVHTSEVSEPIVAKMIDGVMYCRKKVLDTDKPMLKYFEYKYVWVPVSSL